MREVHAGFYWFVTATPYSINRHHRLCKGFMRELFGNTYDFENFIDDIIVKNDPEFIKQSFAIPETIKYYHKCYMIYMA